MTTATTAPLRILLVDGDDDSRRALRALLEARGHTVQEADDGLDGVRKALAWLPDLMVVEIGMPILDGYGVARRVRRDLGDGVRLIALTGHDDRQRSLAAGFDEHYIKPANPALMHTLLKPAAA